MNVVLFILSVTRTCKTFRNNSMFNEVRTVYFKTKEEEHMVNNDGFDQEISKKK